MSNLLYTAWLFIFLLTTQIVQSQSFGGVSAAGGSGYMGNWTGSSSFLGRSCFYSNSNGDAVSKEVHFKLNNVQTGDSIILLSDTVGFQARCLDKNSGWINVVFKSGLSVVTGARNGFRLVAGDTSIDIEVKYNRTTTMASSVPKQVRFLYKNSQTGVVSTSQYYDLAPRIYTLSNVYRWTGATSKNYSTSTNWIPERSNPSTSDLLIFDQFDTADVEIVNGGARIDQEVGQIMVTNYTKVRFSNYRNNGDNSVSTLRLGTANTNRLLFRPPTFQYPVTVAGSRDLALGDDARIFISGTDTITFRFKTGAAYGSSAFATRMFKTLNDRGNGAVLKFYFEDNVSSISVFSSTYFKNAANTAIYLDGSNVTVNGFGPTFYNPSTPSKDEEYIGGPGALVVGPNLQLYFEENDNNHWFLDGPLHVLGTIRGNLKSNAPAANTESAWNSWVPNIKIVNNGITSGRIGDQTHPWVSSLVMNITGGVEWQMYNSGNRAWRTVGFPFSTMHVSQISKNIVVTGTKNATNKDSFFSFNTTCSHCKTSLYAWDEGTSAWSGFESGTTANKIDAGEGVLLFFRGLGSSGLGDAAASASAGVMSFKGTPVVGSKTLNLTYNSNGGSLKGVNLVANPYMSNVDWNALTRTNVANKFYFYDPAGKMYNTYDNTGSSVVVNGTNAYKAGTTLETRTIEQGAAFFAIATGSSATLKFDETDKIATKGSASAFREDRTFPCNRLSMTLTSQDTTKKELDHATLEWDMSEKGASATGDFMDMPKIYGGYYGIGTLDAAGEWYVIDRRPDLEAGVTESVNMKIASHEKNGAYRMRFEMCGEAPSATVVLVDRLKGTKTPVGNTTVYEFAMNESDALKGDRFALELMKANGQMALDVIQNTVSVYPNPAEKGGVLYLSIAEGNRVLDAQLYDLNGKAVQNWSKSQNQGLELKLNARINSGVYILEVRTQQGLSRSSVVLSER
jgi:hypothetical protein